MSFALFASLSTQKKKTVKQPELKCLTISLDFYKLFKSSLSFITRLSISWLICS